MTTFNAINQLQDNSDHNGTGDTLHLTAVNSVVDSVDVSAEVQVVEAQILSDDDVVVETLAVAASSPAEATSVALSRQAVNLPQSVGRRAFGIANRMAQAKTLENLYQVTVTALRKRFECDRAFIYQARSTESGRVIAESVTSGYTPTLGELISPLAFGASSERDYLTRSAIVIADASEEAVSPHQMQLLQRFQVQASLSIPVFLSGQLWGVLVIQQCARTRQWTESEIGVLYQIGTELVLRLQALALQQQTEAEIARGETLGKIFATFADLQIFRRFLLRLQRAYETF